MHRLLLILLTQHAQTTPPLSESQLLKFGAFERARSTTDGFYDIITFILRCVELIQMCLCKHQHRLQHEPVLVHFEFVG